MALLSLEQIDFNSTSSFHRLKGGRERQTPLPATRQCIPVMPSGEEILLVPGFIRKVILRTGTPAKRLPVTDFL